MAKEKIRLDDLLLKKGFAEDISKARSLILSGSVLVNDRMSDKVGTLFDESVEIRIREIIPKYVSRGAYKLKAAFEKWNISVKEKLCIDWGASTGGFTQVLLEEGAGLVFAFDVGYGQMASKVAMNPKVTVRDRFHIRDTSWKLLSSLWAEKTKEEFPDEIFLVMDLSFISLRIVLPVLSELKSKNPNIRWNIVSLFKPQFETESRNLDRGVLRDPWIRWKTIRSFLQFLKNEIKGTRIGLEDSPITGRDGNREILVYWTL
ncbi:TlyA family RNA methyltransferase [Leptospira haakeii]|uniref:TlyA family rRNA (Cytidine-2'-O)-methyltransferase n=1 Tax=Leptospira haakeii TaxID=2023198 RepID=A0ABX4PU42_9LEPT|nr:TlyA family RNA methyltransferase [Leptospira haakeii]PKA17908.1 TlyA family rRNA (cytidine-2'-O)-methyltransferase [Leptospira haakeii]PKA21633.1 TlyA family rRNA (cytidine-2'-O)-methyltransferase [Leptospira haakeii]